MHPVNVTCFVGGYYPTIQLYFRNEATKIKPLLTKEVNNTDGTRNMTVTITALGSDHPYSCVASDIPGHGEVTRESTIFVRNPAEENTPDKTSEFMPTDGNNSPNKQHISK